MGLWALIVLYAAARPLQAFPGRVPMLAVVILHVLPPAVFAFVHGSLLYRLRGIVVFISLALGIGGICETIGVLTGFPFGRYYFTDLMGPKLFVVPTFLGLAYVGVGYLSWTLARIITGELKGSPSGWRVVTTPIIASFIMVAWDLSMDAVWSTILHAWIWVDGGAYFGVPVSNFFGWFLTVYLIYQVFALYLRKKDVSPPRLSRGYWAVAIFFYTVVALGNLLVAIPRPGFNFATDPSGTQWKISDITGVSALISILLMGGFALIASVRLADQSRIPAAQITCNEVHSR